MKRMRGQGGVYGGDFFLFQGGKLNTTKITKIKYDKSLRWLPFDILNATTNQNHVGVMEGGWDRPHNHASTLGERDGNNTPLAEGDNNNNDNDNGKDCDILDDHDKYAVGIDGVNKPLDKSNDECDTLSAAPTRVCPESQWLSVPSR